MPQFGFHEKIVRLRNPLPDVDEAEVLKKANIHSLPKNGQRGFVIEERYSAGVETQRLTLQPGEEKELPEEMAHTIAASQREKGLYVVPLQAEGEPDDVYEERCREAEVTAVMRAARFFDERGATQLRKQRSKNGLTLKEQREEMREVYAAYYANDVRSDLCKKLAEKLKAKAA